MWIYIEWEYLYILYIALHLYIYVYIPSVCQRTILIYSHSFFICPQIHTFRKHVRKFHFKRLNRVQESRILKKEYKSAEQPFYFSVNFECSQNWLHSKWNRIRQDRPKRAVRKKKKKKTSRNEKTPNEFFLSLSHTKSAKKNISVFRRLLHNILCLILMNARDCAKSRNRREKIYSAKRCVYLKLNLSSKIHENEPTYSCQPLIPLSSCLSHVRFVRNIPFTVTSKTYTPARKEKKKKLKRTFCLTNTATVVRVCERHVPTDEQTNKREPRACSMYGSAACHCIRCVVLSVLEHAQ